MSREFRNAGTSRHIGSWALDLEIIAPDRTMGTFKISRKLGQGGMGVVYRARQEPLDREVAVKFLLQTSPGQETLVRFRREVEAMANLSHPNIVKVLEHGQTDQGPFFVMEYVPGVTVRQLVSTRGPLAGATLRSIAEQLSEALAECHSKGYVHRDIKPGNVMVTENGRVVLMDFGLVRPPDGTVVTGDGQLIGTPLFLAPELLMGKPSTAASDIYAMGALLYEAATGEPVFEGPSVGELIRRALSERPVPIRDRRPELPWALVTFVEACLERDPARRIPDGMAAVRALRRATASPERSPLSAPRIPPPVAGVASGPLRRGLVIAGAGALAIAGLAMCMRWRMMGHGGGSELPLPVAVAAGPGSVILRWTGSGPRIGRVRVLPARGGAPVAEATDATAVSDHRIAIDRLEPGTEYRIEVADGDGRHAQLQVVAGTIDEAASRALAAIDAFSPGTMLERIGADLDRRTSEHRRHPGRLTDGERSAWHALLAQRCKATGLCAAFECLGRVREKAFFTGAMSLATQTALLRDLRRVWDLAWLAHVAGIQSAVDPDAVLPSTLRTRALAAPRAAQGFFYLFDTDSADEAVAVDPLWKRLPTEITDKLNLIAPSLGAFLDLQIGTRTGGGAGHDAAPGTQHVPRTPMDLPGPAAMAAPEVVVQARGLNPGVSLTVIWSRDRHSYAEIADLDFPDTNRNAVARPLDPRLCGPGKIWLGLRIRTAPRVVQTQSCKVYFLGLRWTAVKSR